MARRENPEINAGSMADIAFLLLIFFLVTTTIEVDKGILVKLPPWSDEEPETQRLKDRNVFSVLVNAQNQLLVRGEPTQVGDLKERTKELEKLASTDFLTGINNRRNFFRYFFRWPKSSYDFPLEYQCGRNLFEHGS